MTTQVLVLLVVLVSVLCSEETDNPRDKRTVDFVIRSVADVFGYDVQKRPSIIPPPAPKPTFFPPPVGPLPPPKAPPMPPMPSPKAPPAKVPPPPPPPFTPVVKVAPPMPGPKAPPAKVPPPPPPPRPVVRVAPIPAVVTAPPLLTETVRKTFNINFNWAKNLQPQGAVAPPAAPPPGPKSPPPPASNPPPPPPPPPPPAAPPQPKPMSKWTKPQLIEYYDYQDEPQQKYNQYEDEEQKETQPLYAQYPQQAKYPQQAHYPQQENYPTKQTYYTNSEPIDSYGNKVTPYYTTESAQNIQTHPEGYTVANPQGGDYDHSKDRFKESIKTFWNNSPWTHQNGYKFIMSPEAEAQTQENLQENSANLQENYQEDYPEKLVIYEVDRYPPTQEYRQDLEQYDELQGERKGMEKRHKPKQDDSEDYQKEMLEYEQIIEEMSRAKPDKNQEPPEELLKYEEYEIIENKDGGKSEKFVKLNNQIPAEDYEKYYDGAEAKSQSKTVESKAPSYMHYEHQISEEDFHKLPIFRNMDFETFGHFDQVRPKPQAYPKKVTKITKKQPIKSVKVIPEESQNSQVVQPLFSGVLPVKAHQDLLKSEDKQAVWQVPFEMEYSGSEKRRKIKKPAKNFSKTAPKPNTSKPNRLRRQVDFNGDYKYEPEAYNEEFTYTVPEPSTENYEQFEKHDYKDDEEDKDFSKNAKITTRQSGKKITILRKQPLKSMSTN